MRMLKCHWEHNQSNESCLFVRPHRMTFTVPVQRPRILTPTNEVTMHSYPAGNGLTRHDRVREVRQIIFGERHLAFPL